MSLTELHSIVGIITILLFSSALLIFVISYLIESINNFYDRWKYNHSIQIIHQIGENLKLERHWYSESNDAKFLLECIGEAYMTTDSTYIRMDDIRSKWRQKLNEQKQTENTQRVGTLKRADQESKKRKSSVKKTIKGS